MPILSAEEIIKYGRRLAEDLSDLGDAAGHNAFLGERVAHPVSEDLYEKLMAELLDCHDKIKEHIEEFKTAYYERTKGSNNNDVGDESPQSSEPTSPIYTPPSSPELPASPIYTPPSPQLPASPIYVPTSPNYTPPEQDELPVISLDEKEKEKEKDEEEVQYLGSRKRRRLA
ncbi:uncharacterized protein LTHEOB_3453 [Lasiodiplodia theobromae]|uniref:uncharacterized protein n=1 Tax=Lasiodiplodia theobromae TaxID=45133 RepID=UPI0015C30D54|nr:uncharacterized protein LTHEOB_3453 [Lasiodiplodia theobromae]KAF4533840.1 hypothetical protein LTHEOB_3453 [Lasiodiplodia theobromae]